MENTPAAIVEEYLKKQPRGFRFHPTDKEIVQYIKDKYGNKNIPTCIITQVMNLNNFEPWELLPIEKLGEKYFLCQPELKYGKGVRTNRQTREGYWKSTGNMKEIRAEGSVIGRRYTLAFHTGKAPEGKKTNWFMHEYRLGLDFHNDEWVICKIFLMGTSKNKITSSKADEENGIEINSSSLPPPPPPPPPQPQEEDIVDTPNDLNILASTSGFYQNQFTNNFPGMENEFGIDLTSTSNAYEENGIVGIFNCPNIFDSSYDFDTDQFINNSPSMENEYGIGEFYTFPSWMNIEDVIIDEFWP